MEPTVSTVQEAISECRNAGIAAFLEKHASGHEPRDYYLNVGGAHFPLKAIWAAAHRPSIQTREFNTRQARRGLKRLGLDHMIIRLERPSI